MKKKLFDFDVPLSIFTEIEDGYAKVYTVHNFLDFKCENTLWGATEGSKMYDAICKLDDLDINIYEMHDMLEAAYNE